MGDARKQDPDRTPPRDDASTEAASPSWIPLRRSPEETMRILKALTNPLRMRILRVLSLGEAMRVSDIARAVDAPANSVSYHLRQLERADIAHRGARDLVAGARMGRSGPGPRGHAGHSRWHRGGPSPQFLPQ